MLDKWGEKDIPSFFNFNDKGLIRELTEKSFANPSVLDTKPDATENTGIFVLPGTYTVRIKYNNETQTQKVNVLADPRIKTDAKELKENYELAKTNIHKWDFKP